MQRQLEDILKDMRLRQPSAELDRRIADDARAAEAPIPGPWLHGPLKYVAAVAAMLVLGVVIFLMSPQDPAIDFPAAEHRVDVQPVVNETVFARMDDEGVIYLDDQTPVRQFRQQTIQRTEWTDADGTMRMETTVPREEVLLVPVDFD